MNCNPSDESASPRLYDPALEAVTPPTLTTDFPLPEIVITLDVCPEVIEEMPTIFCESEAETVRDISEGEEILAEFSYDMNGTRLESFSSQPSAGDEEFGMTYHRARCYDPAVGHWLSQEPISHTDSDSNLYRHVGNEPGLWLGEDGSLVTPEETRDQ